MAGIPHHVMNRASRRAVIFAIDEDYQTFEDVLFIATRKYRMRLLDYSVMPNHWHLIVWPDRDVQTSLFAHWLTMTQTQRWHAARGTTGTGPLYQGRFKAFPIQADDHFLTVARYVARNPVRAGLVRRVEEWRCSSAWQRCNHCDPTLLAAWPVPMPENWQEIVNEPMEESQLRTVRDSVAFGWPYGDEEWTREMAEKFALKRVERIHRKRDRMSTFARRR